MIEYPHRPDALLAGLINNYGADGAVRRLSLILRDNDKARLALAHHLVSNFGRCVTVPHLGTVS